MEIAAQLALPILTLNILKYLRLLFDFDCSPWKCRSPSTKSKMQTECHCCWPAADSLRAPARSCSPWHWCRSGAGRGRPCPLRCTQPESRCSDGWRCGKTSLSHNLDTTHSQRRGRIYTCRSCHICPCCCGDKSGFHIYHTHPQEYSEIGTQATPPCINKS